jgi:hypothetical protein
MLTPSASLKGVGALELSEEAEQLFLSGNAARVFALED